MTPPRRIDMATDVLDITADWSVSARKRQPGPPQRIDGMTFGVVTLQPGESPHNGEMHPDGDEILYVVSGTATIASESEDALITLTAGQSHIVPKGVWHQVDCLEESVLIHLTPGPGGEARF
ncbi:MAG: cupin domain-containing protein [Pseudomonadaceae bacterium]|nr:cupin domain-containing protein [Pseudomonadaceae bacterium]